MSLYRSAAWPLTWIAVALVVYATLYPLSGFVWPSPGVFGWALPKLPSEQTKDLVENLLGYMPLGAIMCLALLRSGWHVGLAAVGALLGCSALSYGLELAQFMLPTRTPSISDWTLNTLGAAWGVMAAITLHALGLVDVWHRLRERWFIPQAGWGLALLWMWPLGLLFPPPLPLAQGQLWPPLKLWLVDVLADTPWQHWLVPETDPLSVFLPLAMTLPAPWWQPLRDVLIVALGVLAPMCLACAVARPMGLRLVLLAGAVAMAVLGSSLSAALNFGPEHLLVWLNVQAVEGLLLGSVLGALLLDRSRTAAALAGMAVLAGLVVLVHGLPQDPYHALTLQAWEHGRFVRFHGLSRWFGLLWPYVAFVWLLGRAASRALDTPAHS